MGNIIQLSDQFFVAPQIDQKDIALLKSDYGIQTVICNKPDSEILDHELVFKEIELLCHEKDIATFHQPITRKTIDQEAILLFNQIVENNKPKVLAYCKTGTRSAILWAYSQIYCHQAEPDEVQDRLIKAGFSVPIN